MRSNKAIEGIRTALSLVVLLHHIDILNPALLNEDNVLWTNEEPPYSQRHLLKFAPLPRFRKASNIWTTAKHSHLSPFGLFVFVFNGYLAVTIFLILSGYILSFEFFDGFARSIADRQTPILWPLMNKLIRLCIKRSLRFIFPLLATQIFTFLLWYFGLIQFSNPKRWIFGYQSFEIFYAKHWHFDFLFFFAPNGALWIMKDLFYAPMVVIPVIVCVVSLKRFSHRVCVYLAFGIIYFDTPNFAILCGVVISDLLHYGRNTKILQIYFDHKLIVTVSCLFLLFAKQIFDFSFLIDFNLSMTFRSVIWANLSLLILGYPKNNNVILKIFELPILASFGKFTFCLYITHIPVYRLIAAAIDASYHSWLSYHLFGIAMALSFSVIFHFLIEVPSKKYFVKPIMEWIERNSMKFKQRVDRV